MAILWQLVEIGVGSLWDFGRAVLAACAGSFWCCLGVAAVVLALVFLWRKDPFVPMSK